MQTVIREWAKEQQTSASNDGVPPNVLPIERLYEAQRSLLALIDTLIELIVEPNLWTLEVSCQYCESRSLL